MNLIITCARRMEQDAKKEITSILGELGDAEPAVCRTDMPGILTATTCLDPLLVTKSIRRMLRDEPWNIRYCLRLIPVQRTVKTDVDEIRAKAMEIIGNISKDDTYKIAIEKRDTGISGSELISSIAGQIPNRVSLEGPDKLVLIEVLGKTTGIAVIPADGIFSAEKEKRLLGE